MKKAITLIVCLALAFAAFACAKSELGGESDKAAADAKVIATVDNVKITDADIEKMLEGIRDPRQKMRFATAEGKKQLVDKLVDIELVAAAARADGMINDEEVKQLLENYTKQVLFVAYLQKKMKEKTQEVSEETAQAYYNEHPDEFVVGEQVKARHILIKVDKDADEAAVETAHKKALDLYKKIKAGGDFAELAKANSDDPGSKIRGGSLGFFPRGRMVPEFDEVAFGLEAGQTAEPVKSQFGWHVIQVEERKPEEKKTFEEVKQMLMRKLSMEQQQNSYESIVGELRTKAKVNVDEQALEELNIAGPQMGGMPGMPGQGGMMPPQLQGAAPAQP